MGNTSSIPPPLVQYDTPSGRVTAPQGGLFRPSRNYGPECYSYRDVFGGGFGPRRPRADLEIVEEGDERFVDGMGMDMGMGMDPGHIGGGYSPGYYESMGGRIDPRGGVGHLGMGMSMPPSGGGGMHPRHMSHDMPYMGPLGDMGGDLPPRYTPLQRDPSYMDAKMPGHRGPPNPYANPYAYPNRPSSPPISTATSHKRPSRRDPGRHERIPMGAFATSNYLGKPSASARLNRRQPSDKKVGPSGHEWIKGDSFLDACTCTTTCTCRAGQRVLYRSKDDDLSDTDSDTDGRRGPRYGKGEIRYVLKNDLGRNCDDHSKCRRRSSSSSPSDSSFDKRSKKNKEDKARKKEFKTMKDELLNAFDERLADIKSTKSKSSKAGSVTSPIPNFAGFHNPAGPYGPSYGGPYGDHAMGAGNTQNPYAGGTGGRMPPHANFGYGLPPHQSHRPGGMMGGGMYDRRVRPNDNDSWKEYVAYGGPYGTGAEELKKAKLASNRASPRRPHKSSPSMSGEEWESRYGQKMRDARRDGSGLKARGRTLHFSDMEDTSRQEDKERTGSTKRQGTERRNTGTESPPYAEVDDDL